MNLVIRVLGVILARESMELLTTGASNEETELNAFNSAKQLFNIDQQKKNKTTVAGRAFLAWYKRNVGGNPDPIPDNALLVSYLNFPTSLQEKYFMAQKIIL